MIIGVGLVHLYSAPVEYEEAPYMGFLFVANCIGAIIAAVGIYRGERIWGWGLGLMVSGGAFVGFILSRTVGLPGMKIETWLQPIGLIIGLILSFFPFPKRCSMEMYIEQKQQVVDICRKLVEKGYLMGTRGNISVRVKGQKVLIDAPIPALFDEQVRFLGRSVEIVNYAPSGTGFLKKNIVSKLHNHANAYILQNHGVLCLGPDAERTIFNVQLLEKCAVTYLLALCTEKEITRIPLPVREIVFSMLRKDQQKTEAKP